MSEFLQNYGFFMLVAVLMLICHLGHGGHGRGDDQGKRSGGGGHQH